MRSFSVSRAIFCFLLVQVSHLGMAHSARIEGLLFQLNESAPLAVNLNVIAPEIKSIYSIDGTISVNSGLVTQERKHETSLSVISDSVCKADEKDTLVVQQKVQQFSKRTIDGFLSGVYITGKFQVKTPTITFGTSYKLGFNELYVDGIVSNGVIHSTDNGIRFEQPVFRFGEHLLTPLPSNRQTYFNMVTQTSQSPVSDSGYEKTSLKRQENYSMGFMFDDLKVAGDIECSYLEKASLGNVGFGLTNIIANGCRVKIDVLPKDSTANVTDLKLRRLVAFLELILPNSLSLGLTSSEA